MTEDRYNWLERQARNLDRMPPAEYPADSGKERLAMTASERIRAAREAQTNPYYLESWLAGDVMISRPLLARLMAAIETPDDLEEWEVAELLEDAGAVYGEPRTVA